MAQVISIKIDIFHLNDLPSHKLEIFLKKDKFYKLVFNNLFLFDYSQHSGGDFTFHEIKFFKDNLGNKRMNIDLMIAECEFSYTKDFFELYELTNKEMENKK